VSTNVEIVTRIQKAIIGGNLIELMGYLARDVRWRVNVTDRSAAPWFGDYTGKQGVLAFFEALSQAQLEEFTVKAVIGNGDLVMVWLHVVIVGPGGGAADMDEVQVWQFREGKVQSVELFPDTLAIASCFSPFDRPSPS